jgi:3,4-dihydroxy 2-butanone 4-phosphate synthase/GTP cyclohydrolase II
MGLDTVEANERLGFPADLRNYGVGAQILNDLGVKQIRLITNNPRKIAGLKGYGLEVVDRVPLLIEANDYNSTYLATKASKLGHLLLQTYLFTVAIHWQEESLSVTQRYERLEKLRHITRMHDLLLQEEARPLAIALFGQPSLTIHIGLDQPNLTTADWYQQPQHPYLQAIGQIIDNISTLPYVRRLEFLVAAGHDPLTGLQVQLNRQNLGTDTPPSTIFDQLETQKIYCFG